MHDTECGHRSEGIFSVGLCHLPCLLFATAWPGRLVCGLLTVLHTPSRFRCTGTKNVHHLLQLYVGLGIRTQVLTFAQQAPHPQSQLPCPRNSLFYESVESHTEGRELNERSRVFQLCCVPKLPGELVNTGCRVYPPRAPFFLFSLQCWESNSAHAC